MNALDLARWQFAITTVYHFLFVPITIGMGFLVAGLQTAWYRTNKLKYLRATKFFGKLFLPHDAAYLFDRFVDLMVQYPRKVEAL